MIEQQVSYVLAALEQLDRRGARAIDVTSGAQQRWDAEIRERSASTVGRGLQLLVQDRGRQDHQQLGGPHHRVPATTPHP
ncbi:MAG: hypothetical protein R2789_10170 [Microthrixaceae bacterium]